MRVHAVLAYVLLLSGVATVSPAWAQRGLVDGHVSLTTDYLPNVDDTLELRARLFVERQVDAGSNVRFRLSGWAEGLVADRGIGGKAPGGAVVGGAGSGSAGGRGLRAVRDAVARPHEAYVDVRAGRVDLRAGLSTVVWGRLDEVQPSDVVNPLDISRYLFEGRAEARLPVPMVRGRWVPNEAFAVEGVWVPLFRRGRADFLDEDSSPFSLLTAHDLCQGRSRCSPAQLQVQPSTNIEIAVDRDEPARAWRSTQGGVRLTATTGRADWSVSAYRGFETFGVVTLPAPAGTLRTPGSASASGASSTFSTRTTLSGVARAIETVPVPGTPIVVSLVETFPRFTMIASDVEAVRGQWTLRGEVAGFFDQTLQSPDAPVTARGHSIDGGASLERRAGDYRINSAVLLQHRDASASAEPGAADAWSDTDVSLVTGVQRTFARDTRRLLLFGVWNVADATGFLRTIGAWSLQDNLWLEGSVGWFFGEGTDTLSRFGTRDFAYVRLKAYF